MPKKVSGRVLPWHQLSKLLSELESSRKPAKVVTPGGVAPRGGLSSWKCRWPHFQSLVEEDFQRVAEIASSVTAYETHPITLELGDIKDRIRYTPDLILRFEDLGAVVEVKPKTKLASMKTAARLRDVMTRLESDGIPLCVVLDADVRPPGLQTSLKLIQRHRPARGRFQPDLDISLWDPLMRTTPSPEQLARWNEAKQICDDLLRRVMRRDPGELLAAA